jgi:hypothetical protein
MTDDRAGLGRVAAPARILGAVAVLAVGLDHLWQYDKDFYSAIPTIGTLFVLNFVSAAVVALGLIIPWRRLSPRRGAAVTAVLAAVGVAIAAGSLAALEVSETSGLFGFTEVGYRGAIVLSIALDATATLLLVVFLVTALRRPPPATCAALARIGSAPRPRG